MNETEVWDEDQDVDSKFNKEKNQNKSCYSIRNDGDLNCHT